MYEAPSVETILQDLRSSVKSSVVGTDPWVWPNNLTPTLKAVAQGLRGAYLRLEFIHEQAFVTTAVGEYLDFHGIQAGGLSRNPTMVASGTVDVPATPGSVISDGTTLSRSDGQLLITIGTVTVVTSPAVVPVRAVEPGLRGNLAPGTILTSLVPIIGLTGEITVSAEGLVGGAERESDESFRERILFFKQNPPHGGSPSEYLDWAQTKPGVTRVFVKRATPQPGSVTVYFMMDGTGTGIPSAADVTDMQNILNALGPADAEIIVRAPVEQAINVTITGLVPNTPAMKEAITQELKAQFIRKAEPATQAIVGGVPNTPVPFTFARAWITEAISLAPGWVRSRVTDPGDDVVVTTPHNIPVLGVVSIT